MFVGSHCETDQKIHLLSPGYFQGKSFLFSAHRSGSQYSCASSFVGKLRTSSSLCWHYLPAPHAGSCSELPKLPATPWKHQSSQGDNQPFAGDKHWEEATL